jgi:hypothetical protein
LNNSCAGRIFFLTESKASKEKFETESIEKENEGRPLLDSLQTLKFQPEI